MKLIRFLPALFLGAAVAYQEPLSAQPSPASTKVEMLGLRHWTVGMVEEAVSRYVPGTTLEDADCAVILRDSVGFPDVTTFSITDGDDTRWRVLILIEPESREYVRFVPTSGEYPEVQAWGDVFAAMDPDLQLANQLTGEVLLGDAGSPGGRPVPESLTALRESVRRHDSEQDRVLAGWTLLNDSNWRNRTVASLILSNFAERDSTLYLLVEGLRWPHGTASEASYSVLSAIVRGRAEPVDWVPARDGLTALTGGTGLGMLPKVLTLLIDSRIDRKLGQELARVNPHLLLDLLRAGNPISPIAVQNFLQYVSGFEAPTYSGTWEDFLFDISGLEYQETL